MVPGFPLRPDSEVDDGAVAEARSAETLASNSMFLDADPAWSENLLWLNRPTSTVEAHRIVVGREVVATARNGRSADARTNRSADEPVVPRVEVRLQAVEDQHQAQDRCRDEEARGQYPPQPGIAERRTARLREEQHRAPALLCRIA